MRNRGQGYDNGRGGHGGQDPRQWTGPFPPPFQPRPWSQYGGPQTQHRNGSYRGTHEPSHHRPNRFCRQQNSPINRQTRQPFNQSNRRAHPDPSPQQLPYFPSQQGSRPPFQQPHHPVPPAQPSHPHPSNRKRKRRSRQKNKPNNVLPVLPPNPQLGPVFQRPLFVDNTRLVQRPVLPSANSYPQPPAVQRINDDGPSGNCIDYRHAQQVIELEDDEEEDPFDRNILFSPVPSEDSNNSVDEVGQNEEIAKSYPPVVPVQMEDFLKSCREESVRIQTEKVAVQPSVPKAPTVNPAIQPFNFSTASNGKGNGPAQVGNIEEEVELVNVDDDTEAIKQRVIKEFKTLNSASTSTKKCSNGQSCRTSTKAPSTWLLSNMPSKPNVEPDKPEKEDGPVTELPKKTSKVYEEIKKRLQKTQIGPVVNINGNIKEVILPLNFTVNDYLDQLLSPTFESQELKKSRGKYFIYFVHRLS